MTDALCKMNISVAGMVYLSIELHSINMVFLEPKMTESTRLPFPFFVIMIYKLSEIKRQCLI